MNKLFIHRPKMIGRINYLFIAITLAIAPFVAPPTLHAANGGSFMIKPASGQTSPKKGDVLKFNIYASIGNTDGEAVTSGTLSYTTRTLDFIQMAPCEISNCGQMVTTIKSTNAPASPNFRGVSFTSNSKSGTKPAYTQGIMTVQFKVIAGGQATIQFENGAINGYETSTAETWPYYTASIPQPASPQPSTPTVPPTIPTIPQQPVTPQSPSQTSPGEQTQTPSPEAVETTPDPSGNISNVSVSPSYDHANIEWTVVDDKASTKIQYGDSVSETNRTAEPTKDQTGKYNARIPNLTPGLRYSFTITSSVNGEITGTYSGTIIAIGYPVTFTVTENNAPIANGVLKINNSSYPINGDKVTINIAAGKYTATVTTDTASDTKDIEVVTKKIPVTGSPETQKMSFALTSSLLDGGPSSGSSILTFVGIMMAGIAFLSIGGFVFITIRRKRLESGGYGAGYSPQGSIRIDDGYTWQDGSQPTTPTTPSTNAQSFNKSVYIDDEEIVDMFDQANTKKQSDTSPTYSNETPRNPNQ